MWETRSCSLRGVQRASFSPYITHHFTITTTPVLYNYGKNVAQFPLNVGQGFTSWSRFAREQHAMSWFMASEVLAPLSAMTASHRTEPEAARTHCPPHYGNPFFHPTHSSKGLAPESAFRRQFLNAALHNKGLFLNRCGYASRPWQWLENSFVRHHCEAPANGWSHFAGTVPVKWSVYKVRTCRRVSSLHHEWVAAAVGS